MERDLHARVVERAHELWVAYCCPSEGDAMYKYQATQEVEFNDRLLAAKSGKPRQDTADRAARVGH